MVLNASNVPSLLCDPMRVFHTSNGMPSDAASMHWMRPPMARSTVGMVDATRKVGAGGGGTGARATRASAGARPNASKLFVEQSSKKVRENIRAVIRRGAR